MTQGSLSLDPEESRSSGDSAGPVLWSACMPIEMVDGTAQRGAQRVHHVHSRAMRFGWKVRRDGISVLEGLGPRYHDAPTARLEAEAQVLRAGWIEGDVEVEVGGLAAGVVCIDRRLFHILSRGPA